jgi:hypothetical protein
MNTRLNVYHLAVTYIAPRDLRDPMAVQQRLGGALRNGLATICGRLLTQVLDPDDPSVWLIRSVDIDLAMDVSAADEEFVAQTWGHRIAMTIARTIARGADGDSVLHFADWATYLAQFLGDLAEGQAWGKWYYGTFESLRGLSTGATIREALLCQPEQAEAVLLGLAVRGRLDQILSAMSESDAQTMYETCSAFHTTATTVVAKGQLIEGLLSVWPDASLYAPLAGMATAHHALRLYIAARQRLPSLQTASLRPAINHLLGFAEILRRVPMPGAWITHLTTGDIRTPLRLARSNGMAAHLEALPFFAQVAAGDSAWLAHVAHRITAPTTTVQATLTADRPTVAQMLGTPFGGIFLLLPSLLDLGIAELIKGTPYPDSDGISKAQALRYLLALKCLGRPRAIAALNDPVLPLAVGLGTPPSCEAIRGLDASATVAMDQHCLRRLVQMLARQGRVQGRCLSAEVVPVLPCGGDILLLRDITHDDWVYAAGVIDDAGVTQAVLDQGLRFVQEAVEARVEYLWLGPSLSRRLDADTLESFAGRMVWSDRHQAAGLAPLHLGQPSEESPPIVWMAEPGALPGDLRAALARYLVRAKPADQELAYLALTDLTLPIIANTHFDLTWSLIAHAVLNAFASRLMGFDWSSAEYLYCNFLAGMSAVQVTGEQIGVMLPRSPLHLVLRMAGVDGQTYTVPWLNDAQVTLSLAAD